MSQKKYYINSFFAGIGGFDIAFEKHGFKTIYLCEINPFCKEILKEHWPSIKISDDICKVHADEIPDSTIWCGGFPCQDISVARGASERRGLNGERSGLFYTFAKLIEDCKPQVVLLENVEGLFSSNNGRDFGIILQTMSKLGYSVAWRLLNSRYFGVPQSRTRVYLCCWKNSLSSSAKVMFESQGASELKHERAGFITPANKSGSFPQVPEVSYCLQASSGRHTGTDWSRTYVVCEDGVRRLTPSESERVQGFPTNWTLPISNTSLNEDEIDTLRYTAVGNAVSVPVVEWIAKRIYKELSSNSCITTDEITSYIPEFSNSKWSEDFLLNTDFTDITKSFKWPIAGIAWEGKFIGGKVSPAPSKIIKSSLLALIDENTAPYRYYISPNAAEGILRRVDRQGRKLFPPLREALEKESIKNKQYD